MADLAEVEEYLRSATVVSMAPVGRGITGPRRLELEQRGVHTSAIFRDAEIEHRGVVRSHGRLIRNLRDSNQFECAAYRLDRLLGLGRVPPAVRRTIDRADGTVQLWLEGTIEETARRDRGLVAPDHVRWHQQWQMMELFDNLIGNVDRHTGNILIDEGWNIWLIDHTRAFVPLGNPLYPERITHVERHMWEALQALEEDTVWQALRPYLSRLQIEAVMARRRRLIEYVEGLIDRYGEESVVFELRGGE